MQRLPRSPCRGTLLALRPTSRLKGGRCACITDGVCDVCVSWPERHRYWLRVSLASRLASRPASRPAASDRAKPPAAQAKSAQIQGELANVDAAAKTITVKVADGSEMQFSYNEKTEVTGAKDGAAGLATAKDSRVTVHFNDEAGAKVKQATRIIVQPKG